MSAPPKAATTGRSGLVAKGASDGPLSMTLAAVMLSPQLRTTAAASSALPPGKWWLKAPQAAPDSSTTSVNPVAPSR
jgi:hypothetical protein